jgi:hypothetical protein
MRRSRAPSSRITFRSARKTSGAPPGREDFGNGHADDKRAFVHGVFFLSSRCCRSHATLVQLPMERPPSAFQTQHVERQASSRGVAKHRDRVGRAKIGRVGRGTAQHERRH